jgi:hypothetical protein
MLMAEENKPAGQSDRPARLASPRTRAELGLVLILGAVGLDSAYRLYPLYQLPTICRDAAVLRLDPNVASLAELILLPGLGPGLSQHIIDFRERCPRPPAFRTIEELDAVRGVGPATLAKMRDCLIIQPRP